MLLKLIIFCEITGACHGEATVACLEGALASEKYHSGWAFYSALPAGTCRQLTSTTATTTLTATTTTPTCAQGVLSAYGAPANGVFTQVTPFKTTVLGFTLVQCAGRCFHSVRCKGFAFLLLPDKTQNKCQMFDKLPTAKQVVGDKPWHLNWLFFSGLPAGRCRDISTELGK